MNEVKTHEVTVFLERPGVLGYSNATLEVARGDQIHWKSDFPFAVEFQGVSPCDRRKGGSDKGALRMKVRGDAGAGVYKYFVAAYANGAVVTDDPVIIIE